MHTAIPTNLPVLDAAAVKAHLPQMNTRQTLKAVFKSLHTGASVQPAQAISLFPEQRGDFITYSGILGDEDVFGVKLSPYIVTPGRPVVTAWTLLMSMVSGQPLMLCDAGQLTVERTAATTALAVECLAPETASILTIVGLGAQGQAHLLHTKALRPWKEIRLYAADMANLAASERQKLLAYDERITLCSSLDDATRDADVLLLCTSSAAPVVQPHQLGKCSLITSISTNSAQAHEVAPQDLLAMDVYCDYSKTTPDSAWEMRTAVQEHGWKVSDIKGDLSQMVQDNFKAPNYQRPVYFRSIGLGLEDVAVALELFKQTRLAPSIPSFTTPITAS